MACKIRSAVALGRYLGVLAGVLLLAGCYGGGGYGYNPYLGPTTGPTSSVTGNNATTLDVNSGPTGNYVDGLFTTVEVCEPGSTSNCASVTDVLVDTGSTGLRLLSDAVPGLSLPAVTDSTGNALKECVQFADLSYVWGPVVQADIHIANEAGPSAPIQIISASPTYTVPSSCLSAGTGGSDDNSLVALGANGILGVSNFAQDCGRTCTSAANAVPY
jgi:hypothetical protein